MTLRQIKQSFVKVFRSKSEVAGVVEGQGKKDVSLPRSLPGQRAASVERRSYSGLALCSRDDDDSHVTGAKLTDRRASLSGLSLNSVVR